NNSVVESAAPNPMSKTAATFFILAWLYEKSGDYQKSEKVLKEAFKQPYDYFFPSRLYEQIVLEWGVQKTVYHPLPAYGLGNYYYNLMRHEDAIEIWRKAAENGCLYGTLYRNLGIAYWNTYSDAAKARSAFLKAIELSPKDMRIQFEYDQLRKKLNDSPAERLSDLESIKEDVMLRDDFSVELAALYNFAGKYGWAVNLMGKRNFHPWEGGEGQVLKQYTHACLNLGKLALSDGDGRGALNWFKKAINTPDSLGEKHHPLQAVAHINYWLGKAFHELGEEKKAKEYFKLSASEQGDFIDMAVSAFSELSYYSALSLKELGQIDEAKELLNKVRKFAEEKLKTDVKIDYFATSLPLLLVFEEDLQKRNEWEVRYLLALAETGLGNTESGKKLLHEVLKLNAMHVGAKEFLDAMGEIL
ncbi:MAG: tetratricopeptide repeat protein, partial [Bacteroidales bacterium]|nr:tetratricopeptide repeat protein [Bacteroidales bacterium]